MRVALTSLLLLLAAASTAHAADPDSDGVLTIHAGDGLDGVVQRLTDRFHEIRVDVDRRVGAHYSGPVKVYIESDRFGMEARLKELFDGRQVRVGPHTYGLAIVERGIVLLNTGIYVRDGKHVLDEAESTFRHEYCHLLLGQFRLPQSRFPSWFEEGVCQWVQRTRNLPTEAVLSVGEGRVPPPTLVGVSGLIDRRQHDSPNGYAFAANAVTLLLRDESFGAVGRLGRAFVANGGNFATAFTAAFNEPLGEFERRWQRGMEPSTTLQGVFNFIARHQYELLFLAGAVVLVLGVWARRRGGQRALQRMAWRPDGERDPDWNPASADPEAERAIRKAMRQRGWRVYRTWDGQPPGRT